MTLRVGQKVVCVNNTGAPQLRLHGIYTINKILPYGKWKWQNRIVETAPVELCEQTPHPTMWGFHPHRFRPAVNRKTDISLFQRMLTEKVIEVGEDA